MLALATRMSVLVPEIFLHVESRKEAENGVTGSGETGVYHRVIMAGGFLCVCLLLLSYVMANNDIVVTPDDSNNIWSTHSLTHSLIY